MSNLTQPPSPPSSSSAVQDQKEQKHLTYLHQTIKLAQQSPPKPTNFRVGCVLVSYPLTSSSQTPQEPKVLSTGYTLELAGNTHAEQCALSKLFSTSSSSPSSPNEILTQDSNVILYTSLEPCSVRLSGNTPCVQRIIETRSHNNDKGGIRKVVFGAKEPGTFVKDSQSCRLLDEAGIEWEYIPDLEEEILKVAMEGHLIKKLEGNSKIGSSEQQGQGQGQNESAGDTNTTKTKEIDEEERKRLEAMPRNPKKRMMEVDVPPK